MQKQLFSSGNSQDKYSLQSKSGRKLYRRINGNPRIINKSHLTNRTDNSIGSVALRRTELSNDKIYSRQQDFVPISPSNYNNVTGSLYQLVESKNSPQVSQNPLRNKYEQRMIDARSEKSSRSDSKRSQRHKHHDSKKISKHQIEQLFSLESRKSSRPILNDIKREKSHSRSQKSYDRCSIEQSGQSSIRVKNSNFQNTRPLKSIRSNLKSQIKSPKPRDSNHRSDRYLPITPNTHHQISNLERKYQNYYLNSPRAKDQTHREIKQSRQRQRSRRDRNQIIQVQRRTSKQNELKRYKSDKCIREKDYQVEKKRSSKRHLPEDSQMTNEYQKYNQVPSKKHIKGYKNYKQEVQYGYSAAYQDYPRGQGHHRTKKRQEKYQYDLERKYQGKIDHKQRPSKRSSNYEDSLLQLKSKVYRKDLKNIKIRDQTYSNIYSRYGEQGQENTIQDNYYHQHQKARDERHRKESLRRKQASRKKLQNRQLPSEYSKDYYHSGKGGSHHQIQKKTDISDTFESLILSINSRMLAAQGRSSVKDIKQRIELHLNTLKTIEDYSNEFKKMYEQIEQWEELIFLSQKKYWVQITKVLKYLKLCRQGKRHESQRVHAKGKIFSGSLSPTSKNFCSQNQYIKDTPADELDHIQNPFTFPFSTISEQQIKIFCKSQQGVIKIRELDQECSKAYRKLQDQYNLIIGKSGNHINMVFCDNFADQIYVFMLEEIQQMLPNLEEKEVFEATKIRLGKIVKTGILIAFLNGKLIENFADIITYDDIQTTGRRKRLKIYTCYDIYYETFEKIVVE